MTDGESAPPAALLRWPFLLVIPALAIVPFLFTPIPPLTDVPGHIGRFSVQTAPPGDPIFRYFGFHWALVLNLASDLVVQALHRWFGVVAVIWTLCAATAALTALAILAIARVANPQGASALPWALMFVFNWPFLWGFLNYALIVALALLAFAGWIALARAPWWRAVLALALTPVLLVGHGVAGLVGVGLIAAWQCGDALAGWRRGWRATARGALASWPPVAALVVTLAVWARLGVPGEGPTDWLLDRKTEALLMMLRDQNEVLDIASVALSLLVWLLGWAWGARLRGGAAMALLFVAALFVLTPSLLTGSDRLDTRLAPLIPIVGLVLHDWSRVASRRRHAVLLAGFALLAVRFAVITASFAGYGERYRMELAALDHVPRGARVLNLSRVDCSERAWRSDRLEHLANLATTLRGAWVNAHWAIGGLQLLEVRFRPSEEYAQDPSHLIYPASCVDPRVPFDQRERHTAAETVPLLPLDQVDYLWLIGAKLPPTGRDPRLRPVWTDDISELYAIYPPRAPDRGDAF